MRFPSRSRIFPSALYSGKIPSIRLKQLSISETSIRSPFPSRSRAINAASTPRAAYSAASSSPLRIPRDIPQPAHRLGDIPETRALRVRTVLSEAADRDVDQIGPLTTQLVG